MSSNEEIEVEVVEVGESRPISRPTAPAEEPAPNPFAGGIPMKAFRLPWWLWPLTLILSLLFLLLAAAIAIFIVIPFLIIRAILRLLLGRG